MEIANVGSDPISLDECSLVTFNVFTETTIGAGTVGLSGILDPGETVRVNFTGALPRGPGGIGIFEMPPPPNGTRFSTQNEVTGMIYLSNDIVFGVAHLSTPAHNVYYDCIYGGSGQGFFTRPFTSVGDCFP